ncbi:MAG: sulfotransferase domain-containing protein [Candidatus Aminicenantaceae bacterium]
MILPNLIIPGAQKSGTTTFREILRTHEAIYTGIEKEPHFFSQDRNYSQGVDLYRKNYAHYQGQKIVTDASTSYMPLSFVPERISETLDNDVQFIIVLRNPIDRVISAFMHQNTYKRGDTKRNLINIIPKQLEGLTLEELIQYEEASVRNGLSSGTIQSRDETWSKSGFPFNYFFVSCYSKHISNYFKYFPKHNFLFLTFEEVIHFNEETIQKVAAFLNVASSGFNTSVNIHANPSLVYKSRIFGVLTPLSTPLKHLLAKSKVKQLRSLTGKWLKEKPKFQFSESTYRQLLEIFQPEIQRVEKLTGFDLSSWKVGSEISNN